MKFYNTRRFSDGEYWTTEYSANEMTNINVMTLVVISCILAPIAAIVSGILVLVCIHDLEDEGVVPSIAGLLVSGLFMLDIYYHFVIHLILYIMVGNDWIIKMFYINGAFICIHLFMIVFGKDALLKVGNKKSLLYLCIFIGVVAYFIFAKMNTLQVG